MTTTYNERNLPSQVIFEDAKGNTVTQLIFVRDSAGRLLGEEMHSGEESLLPEVVEKVPPDDRGKRVARSAVRRRCSTDRSPRRHTHTMRRADWSNG